MSIKELEKLNIRQMDVLRKKNEGEIRNIEAGHRKLKTQLSKVHENELVELQQSGQLKIAGETEKNLQTLQRMKDHLEETKRSTQKQLDELKNSNEIQQVQKQQMHQAELEKQNIEHDLTVESLENKFKEEMDKLNLNSKQQLEQLKDSKLQEIAGNQEMLQERLSGQTEHFTRRYQNDAQKYRSIKDDQDTQFRRERFDSNLRQQQELGKLTSTHEQVVKKKNENFRQVVKDQDQLFEEKYAQQLQHHNADFQRLENLYQKVVDKLKDGLQDKLQYHLSRTDDPFYQFTELRPQVKELPDRMIIQVDIPEYAKQDVQLTLNRKEAIVNFNRRYNDTRRDGANQNRISKIETMTTRIPASFELDPKSVKSSYKDGVITYEVSKKD
jgi:HSP20 family molecular chaperone IbpA